MALSSGKKKICTSSKIFLKTRECFENARWLFDFSAHSLLQNCVFAKTWVNFIKLFSSSFTVSWNKLDCLSRSSFYASVLIAEKWVEWRCSLTLKCSTRIIRLARDKHCGLWLLHCQFKVTKHWSVVCNIKKCKIIM
jgi:hypothetical protein